MNNKRDKEKERKIKTEGGRQAYIQAEKDVESKRKGEKEIIIPEIV